MANQRLLDRLRILVVEDEYLIGAETCNILKRAGAEIVGMFATSTVAMSEIDRRSPDAVVLDINLGCGPAFEIADFLTKQGIPFVFATGYDRAIIPHRFSDIECLEKPFDFVAMIRAVSLLWPRGPVG